MKIQSIVLSCLLVLLGAASLAAEETPAAPPKDGVFIHVSTGADNPHRLLMALNMAAMMVEEYDVLVYFDIEAANVVLSDSEDITFAHFPSSHTQIRNLLDKGAILMACPGCLKVIGKTEEHLLEGIKVADRKEFFSFTQGRILSLDY